MQRARAAFAYLAFAVAASDAARRLGRLALIPADAWLPEVGRSALNINEAIVAVREVERRPAVAAEAA